MARGTGAVEVAPLHQYDGSAGYLVDSNVWIDCMDSGSPWHGWAIDQLQACSELGELRINVVIYAELLVPEPEPALLDDMLSVYGTKRSELPWHCAALAAKAFSVYRKRGGARRAPPVVSRSPWNDFHQSSHPTGTATARCASSGPTKTTSSTTG